MESTELPWEEKLKEYNRQMEGLPEATRHPCNDCPWRRESIKGWLGPHSAEQWLNIVHGESAIACHQTIEYSGQDWSELKQCRGAAIYRANVLKNVHNQHVAIGPKDHDKVFSTPNEFREHHASPLAKFLEEYVEEI